MNSGRIPTHRQLLLHNHKKLENSQIISKIEKIQENPVFQLVKIEKITLGDAIDAFKNFCEIFEKYEKEKGGQEISDLKNWSQINDVLIKLENGKTFPNFENF